MERIVAARREAARIRHVESVSPPFQSQNCTAGVARALERAVKASAGVRTGNTTSCRFPLAGLRPLVLERRIHATQVSDNAAKLLTASCE